jgi:hypothetical protein
LQKRKEKNAKENFATRKKEEKIKATIRKRTKNIKRKTKLAA